MTQHTIKRGGQVINIVRYSLEFFEDYYCVYQHYSDDSPKDYAGGFDLYGDYEEESEAQTVLNSLNRDLGYTGHTGEHKTPCHCAQCRPLERPCACKWCEAYREAKRGA